ncbi:MAG: hypothetical protein HXY35_18560 [Chloroflexi bacterium]|nr:hypothetical protein [Chloroflexota bacterium]
MRVLIIILILLAPLSAISAAIYEIANGKQDPTLYLLLVAIPGAFIGALKELKDSGLLPPSRLKFSVNSSGKVKRWSRKNGETIQQVTGIVLAIRIENSDSSKAIDVLDVSITPLDSEIVFHRPELHEVKVGSEKKWLYSIADGGWSELFNDGKQKVIEAKKIRDYAIAVCEYDKIRDEYKVRVSFRDNWKRSYTKVVTVESS